MDAYVLVQTDANYETVAGALREIPGVAFAEDLRGAYDAIALARAASMQDLVDGVLERIRRVPGVTRALPAPRIEVHSAGGRAARDEAA